MKPQAPPSGSPSTDAPRVLVSGASGLVGAMLVLSLRARGHAVFRLVRRSPQTIDEIEWDPAAGRLTLAKDAYFDAVINLAGESVGTRWNRDRKEAILNSRLESTRVLVGALMALPEPPRVLVSASALGYYGSRGDEWLTEDSSSGHGFLAEVCRGWEHEATVAVDFGVRVVLLRTGLVLTSQGGALAKMLPVFRLGLGGRLATGRQWMSWITMDDLLEVIHRALADARLTGPINAVTPHPVRNREFTATVARVLHRPAVLPVPASALRLLFGEMADATLLASARAAPTRLQAIGFEFRHPELALALKTVLSSVSPAGGLFSCHATRPLSFPPREPK